MKKDTKPTKLTRQEGAAFLYPPLPSRQQLHGPIADVRVKTETREMKEEKKGKAASCKSCTMPFFHNQPSHAPYIHACDNDIM